MNGRQIAAEHGAQLDFLSRLSKKVGVVDLVEEFFDPVVGDWNDLREEAERWRKAAHVTEVVTKHVVGPLGSVDAAWHGRDADTFVEHMRSVGLAGSDMSDAMTAMADALEETADTVRDIVRDMASVLSDAAESVSGAASLPLDGDAAVVKHLEELREPVRELHDSVRDVLEAFLKLCDGLTGSDGNFGAVTMKHRYPEENWSYTPPTAPKGASVPSGTVDKGAEKATEPAAAGTAGAGKGGGSAVGGGGGGSSISSALGGGAAEKPQPMQPGGSTGVAEPLHSEPAARPAAAAAAGGAPSGASGGGMAGGGMMAPMMGAMGGQQGGDKEHKPKQRLTGSVEDLLGKPKKASPKTIGDED